MPKGGAAQAGATAKDAAAAGEHAATVAANFGPWALVCADKKTKGEKPSCSLVQALIEKCREVAPPCWWSKTTSSYDLQRSDKGTIAVYALNGGEVKAPTELTGLADGLAALDKQHAKP